MLCLEGDCDDVLAALQRYGIAMLSQDIVESVNRILKVGYNDHSDRGGAQHPTLQEARVVARVWE